MNWWKNLISGKPLFGKPKFGALGELFNETHRAFIELTKPTDKIVDVTLTIRIRAFGRDEDKQAAWDKEWRSVHPEWGPVQQCLVSGFPMQLWTDVRERDGQLIFGPHLLGHELIHAIDLPLDGVENTDKYAEMK